MKFVGRAGQRIVELVAEEGREQGRKARQRAFTVAAKAIPQEGGVQVNRGTM